MHWMKNLSSSVENEENVKQSGSYGWGENQEKLIDWIFGIIPIRHFYIFF